MINEQIRDKEVRLIGEDGEQLGIMSARDAFRIAQEVKNEKCTLKDLEYSEKTENHRK